MPNKTILLKYLFRLLVAIPMLCSLAACSNNEDEPEPPTPPNATGQRTVLVYMSAHNNLGYDGSRYDASDLAEMQQAAEAGHFGANRLLVFHSPWHGTPALKEVTSTGINTLKEYPSTFVPVEKDAMSQVIADAKEAAPAKRYGIIFWGHGSGWLENGIRQQAPQRSFGAHQSQSGNHLWINTTTLAEVLDGEGFDYVYFDCCFMGGVEVAYQLRNVTNAVVASASELPSEGMPYHKSLQYLISDEVDLVAAAKTTHEHFNAYTGDQRTNTMSVITTENLNELAATVKAIYASSSVLPNRDIVQQYVSRYDSSNHDLYFDLRNTLQQIATPEQLARFDAALDKCVTYAAATPYLWEGSSRYQVKIDYHCGLTNYIPTSKADFETKNNYIRLDWATDVASALFSE